MSSESVETRAIAPSDSVQRVGRQADANTTRLSDTASAGGRVYQSVPSGVINASFSSRSSHLM